ncbi:hypothetical protein KQX54_005619 [Cotesia glomerata]|uniref:Uncharacterized protein n=1 Tax=Cotesia glomerata TaxID=32391 RepID=A0AAV7HXE4_COTGL|nr:hypothetical protein KQX54_005619 [Cotesia glomerata]
MPFYGLTSPAGAMARGCRRYRGSGTNMSEIHELRVRDRDLDLDCAGKIEESSKVSDRRRGCSGTVTGCQKPKEREEKEIEKEKKKKMGVRNFRKKETCTLYVAASRRCMTSFQNNA